MVWIEMRQTKQRRQQTWNSTEKTSPNASVSLRGTTANQRMEERKRERSQKKADSISRMTRTGSAAMVKMNLVSNMY